LRCRSEDVRASPVRLPVAPVDTLEVGGCAGEPRGDTPGRRRGAGSGERPNQVDRLRDDVSVTPAELLDLHVLGGEVTEEGLRANVSVGVRYLTSWLAGTGAAAIDNLMEDVATAEISRS
jgi:hypothetical protein